MRDIVCGMPALSPQSNKSSVDKLFRSQGTLRPDEIQNLLGIDVTIDSKLGAIGQKSRYFSSLQFFLLWFFSVVLAAGGILFYMYTSQIGLFHETTGTTFLDPYLPTR